MADSYLPQKRNAIIPLDHDDNLVKRSSKRHESRSSSVNFDDGAVNYGRRLQTRSGSKTRGQMTPKPSTSGYPSSSQGQHLCNSCLSLDLHKIQPGPGIWKSTALRLGTLSQFTVDADCLLCQLFASMASAAYAPNSSHSQSVNDITFYLGAFHTSAMYSHNWRNSRTLRGLQQSISYAIIDEKVIHDKEDSFSKERKMSNTLWPSRTSIQRTGWLSPVHEAGEAKRFAARTLEPHADLNVVKSWLNFCLKHHDATCGPTEARPISVLRVVDCNTGLIIAAKLDCRYLALSYVWGPEVPKELVEGESLLTDNTPILIRDAILVTKKLGYQFIWIDRYCIPQEDGKERHSQIQQMDLVYSNAEATIIAISSDDPSQGLHGISSRERRSSVTISIGNVLHSYVPPHPAAEITDSVWNSRGWTYQEVSLSRRRIFFCKSQIYFECAGMRCKDSMASPLELLHTKNLKMFSKWNRPGLFSRIRQTKDPFSAVFDHITIYTRRQLTRPEDILNGIMGTFHAFESIYDSFRHYWGIPMVPDITYNSAVDQETRTSTRTEQFLTGLCWHISGGLKRRLGFPSWSWAGWFGTLSPLHENTGYIENNHGVKIWIDSIFTSQMDLGTFCDATAIDVFPKNPEPYVFIKADFFYVRFRLAKPDANRAAKVVSKWEAVFEMSSGEPIYAPFHITTPTSIGDEFHAKMLKNLWSAFILGDRLKTRIHPATKKRVLSNETPHVIIVVVEELKKEMIERVGIIEVDDPEDRVRLEEIPKHRRVRRYG